MNLIYDKNGLSTTDELIISVADLRDLIQAGDIHQAKNEYQVILDCIAHKNRLKPGSLTVLENPNADIEFKDSLNVYEEVILEKHKIN